MKKYFALLFISFLFLSCVYDDGLIEPAAVEEEEEATVFTSPCENGFADIFPCNGYGLLANVPLYVFNSTSGNDCWGWTDSSNGNEYALMGLRDGTGFVDITDPLQPLYLGKLPTETKNSGWRDIKVYNDHAFIVSEASGHGMQVFDLTRLRQASGGDTYEADALYSEFGSAHNIVINEDSGYAYAVGTETFNGGPHFINIQDPLNPKAAGGYEMSDYSHDAQVVTYNGPDTDYNGREILIGSNENELVIVDITDKEAPVEISSVFYQLIGYTHQGWFTEDQQYFILGDELDEINFGFESRTIVFDFTDLDAPEVHTTYFGPTTAIDHNGYVRGNSYYLANYTAGLRVIDLTDIAGGNLSEAGFFDTFPSDDNTMFDGAWSVYPFFPSGNIIISTIDSGLFIVAEN